MNRSWGLIRDKPEWVDLLPSCTCEMSVAVHINSLVRCHTQPKDLWANREYILISDWDGSG